MSTFESVPYLYSIVQFIEWDSSTIGQHLPVDRKKKQTINNIIIQH